MLLRNQILLMTALSRKYKNYIFNGDFSQGTEGWGGLYGTLSIENGKIKITNDSDDNGDIILFIPYAITTNKKYYIYLGEFQQSAIGAWATLLTTRDADGYSWVEDIDQMENHTESQSDGFIFTASENAGSFAIKAYISKPNYFTLGSVIFIDLTAEFGAGNEPTKEWCDANIPQNIVW